MDNLKFPVSAYTTPVYTLSLMILIPLTRSSFLTNLRTMFDIGTSLTKRYRFTPALAEHSVDQTLRGSAGPVSRPCRI